MPEATLGNVRAHLPVEHLVSEARVEFLGVGLWKRHEIHVYLKWPSISHKSLLRSASKRSYRQPEYTAVEAVAYPSFDRRSAQLRILAVTSG